MSFQKFRDDLLASLNVASASGSSDYRDALEDELVRIWEPVLIEFMQGVLDDALAAYTYSPVLLAAAHQKRDSRGKFVADPFSFTQVMTRWRAAVRRLASVADMDPSEDFIQYTLNGADLPSTAYEQVKDILTQANEESWSEYKLKRQLSRELIPKQSDHENWVGNRPRYRTAVVSMARTASTRISSEDTERVLSSQGYIYKRWNTRRDDRVRSTHHHVHGQTVPLNESFTVGGFALSHPGDPRAPLTEIINCRCFLTGTRTRPKRKATLATDTPLMKGKTMNRTSLIASLTSPDSDLAIWQGVVGVENKPTGDLRLLESGSLKFDTLPAPIRSTREDVGGHQTARTVGLIYSLWREPLSTYTGKDEDSEAVAIVGQGVFDLGSEDGREALRQVREGFKTGVSMDLDNVTYEIRASADYMERITNNEVAPPEHAVNDKGEVVVEKFDPQETGQMQVTLDARLRAVTLVDIPAFSDAHIQIIEVTEDDLPLDDTEDNAVDTVDTPSDQELEDLALADLDDLDFSDLVENLELSAVESPDDETQSEATQYNWVDKVGGLPSYIRRIAKHLKQKGMRESHAIAAAVNTVKRWARGGGKVKPDTRAKALKALAEWEAKKARARATSAVGVETLVASAADIPDVPPEEWFNDPQLTEPTALHVTEDGRVYGHVAAWDTCHIAFPDACTTPPRSATGYAYFHTGSLVTREGVELSVGHLTLGTGHADAARGVVGAQAHYDNTGLAVADVRAGEDAYGIWVAGALRSGITDRDMRTLRTSPLSGDWRRVNGNLEMVGALAVNVPGFPIARPRAYRSEGMSMSLVASGVIAPNEAEAVEGTDPEYLDQLREEQARKRDTVEELDRELKLAAIHEVEQMISTDPIEHEEN